MKPFYISIIIVVGVLVFKIITSGLPPAPQHNVKLYIKYADILEDNIPVQICTDMHQTSQSAACAVNITINNKEQLIEYLDAEYNRDTLEDLARYNEAYKQYKKVHNSGGYHE